MCDVGLTLQTLPCNMYKMTEVAVGTPPPQYKCCFIIEVTFKLHRFHNPCSGATLGGVADCAGNHMHWVGKCLYNSTGCVYTMALRGLHEDNALSSHGAGLSKPLSLTPYAFCYAGTCRVGGWGAWLRRYYQFPMCFSLGLIL